MNVNKIREDFPILDQQVYGKPLVYLDNGATTQKPRVVLETIDRLYNRENGNVHRGVHHLSTLTTENYESARDTVRKYIHAAHTHEIIFTHGTTSSINAVAFSFGEKYVHAGDEIIVSGMEHHANIVPWQMLCERKEARLKVLPVDETGDLMLDKLEDLISDKTRLLAVTQVSNVLGTINPVKEIVEIAHAHDVPVLVDGAQGIQHGKTDVQDMDCDFYVFSGHKIYGPTGVGVLYGKEKWLNEMPPYQGGGDMIKKVRFEKTIYEDLPLKFEAGTMNYIGAIGLGKAIEYLQKTGLDDAVAWEKELLDYATARLKEIPGLQIYGNSAHKISVISFLIGDIHHYDTGMILDKLGIAVRTGHHCAEPLVESYGITGTVRASFAFYNTKEEIDVLHNGLMKVVEMLG
ncbi:MAG TPA: cysteine desulfurase [Bacteroidetes bacterium]|nr:cysteine desulfurase [Bacteroidota bacterium]